MHDGQIVGNGGISIHALLAESDTQDATPIRQGLHFYPRSPCGERHNWMSHGHIPQSISIHALLAESDLLILSSSISIPIFLSTLSLRRATYRLAGSARPALISIHALLAESDVSKRKLPSSCRHFYPRSPCGERQSFAWDIRRGTAFLSTLSLRRATGRAPSPPRREFYFYPRSPCGERQKHTGETVLYFGFLSTLSLRRATTHSSTSL